jgi:ABC-2 type transport system ATP-binding protein
VNAALLGLSEEETRRRFDDIVDFSGVREFIEQPTRTYSSGMLVRLGFSVAVYVNPAILIVDEVLAVGDSEFQDKCLRKIGEMRRNGTTMLCVSHSPKMVLELCDRAIWLDRGRVVLDGPATRVMKAYAGYMDNPGMGLPKSVERHTERRQGAVP